MSDQTTRNWLLGIIAILEVTGGAFGILFVVWWLLAVAGVTFASVLIASIPIGIDIFSLSAGIGLWQGSAFGRNASIVVQTIQLPKIISPALILSFSFGLDFWVYFVSAEEFTKLGFQLDLLANNQLFISAQGAPLGFGLSITAFFSLAMLIKYKAQIKAEQLPPPPPATWE